jgi:hypothetical protein
MSYDQFFGDRFPNALGEPHIGTGSSFIGNLARTLLSLVPEPNDLMPAQGVEDQWGRICQLAQWPGVRKYSVYISRSVGS